MGPTRARRGRRRVSRGGQEGTLRLRERVAELSALLELSTTLGSARADDASLGSALRIILREVGAAAGALFVRSDDGVFLLRASQALHPEPPPSLVASAIPEALTFLEADEVHGDRGLVLLCPIHYREGPIAVLGLGPRTDGRAYGERALGFLRGVAASAAVPLENAFIHDELRRLSGKLSAKVFQLHGLFDISQELAGTFDEEALPDRIVTAAMGHFVVSRGALYLFGPDGLTLAHARGLGPDLETGPIPGEAARAALEGFRRPTAVSALPEGALRRRLQKARLTFIAPLRTGAQARGVLALGERASGLAFSEEDRELAHTLAGQIVAALENARGQLLRAEKQRRDRELQIAREIQGSLFPAHRPELPGFEVAAHSRPCNEVGGDYYDWIPLEGGRLALVVADVSGKGTPASILMASVHAYLQAIAGTAAPARVVEQLNRFVFANTEANRFVTLFYAELDPAAGQLTHVNAGHIPPYRVGPGGAVSRLRGAQGPAVGLLDGASYEAAQVELARGDAIVVVSDGVTDAVSPDDRELGDEGVGSVLRRLSAGSASEIVTGLVAEVDAWTGPRGSHDDLTVLVLKAR